MTAGASPEGILEAQPEGDHTPELDEMTELNKQGLAENAAEEAEQLAAAEAAFQRVLSGQSSNADKDMVVRMGWATHNQEDPDSERPTSITIIRK